MIRKAATERINSQVFFAEKGDHLTGCAKHKADNHAKQAQQNGAYFLPSSLRPLPTLLATDFRPFERELRTTPIVVPTASKTAATVKPYCLKISFTRSWRDSPSLSLSLFYPYKISTCPLHLRQPS